MDDTKDAQGTKRPSTSQEFQDKLLHQRRSTPAGWHDLPAELRLNIYYYLIPRHKLIDVPSTEYPNPFLLCNPILVINKQIRRECLDILYGQNWFKVEMHWGGEADLRENITQENRRRMRLLRVEFTDGICIDHPPRNPDRALWAEILPTVTEIWINLSEPLQLLLEVAAADIRRGLPMSAPVSLPLALQLSQSFDEYLEAVSPYFRCFRDLMNPLGDIKLEGNHSKRTRDIVMSYLTRRRMSIDNSLGSGSRDGGVDGPKSHSVN